MTRFLLALPLLLASTATLAAFELPEPTSQGEAAYAPRLQEDPSRPADAPTAAAIDAITAEDGNAAGNILAAKAAAASSAAYGPRDARLSAALVNLGTARQRAGDVAGALREYQSAIDLIEAAGGPRDPRLFDAWYGMGYASLYAGNYRAASDALANALQLHRMNQGLYSAGQLDVLHALALALRANGKTEDADQAQMRRMDVAQHVFGPESPELAKLFVSGGRWFRGSGQYGQSVHLHGLAMAILQDKDKNDPRLIEPLIEIALSGSERRRDPDELPAPGVLQPGAALAQAERLAAARTDGTAIERAATLVRIGDVHFLIGRRDQALRAYSKAAAALAPEGREPPFAQPSFISFRVPRPAPLAEGAGFVLAEFGVETDGDTRDVRIVESQPATLPATVGSSLISALRQARLRPQISNGKPVASSAVRYRLAVRGGSGP